MTDQEILDDAPERAASIMLFDGFVRYGFADGRYTKCIDCKESQYSASPRSLADIKTIVELKKRIAELETYNGELVSKDVVSEVLNEERIAELEKTVKSLTDGVTHFFHKSNGDINPLFIAYTEALKEQAKQLRAGVK